MTTPASGLFTGYVDAGHLISATSSIPGVLYGCTPGSSGYVAGFTGYTLGGRFSGVFTGFVLAPPTSSAIGTFTGFLPAGGERCVSSFPGFVGNYYTASSGLFTGYTRGYGTTAGAVPASGIFTGYMKRTASSAIPGVVWNPYTASGLFTGYTLSHQVASGVFTGYSTAKAVASGLFTGYTHGF